ncbi:hypothetical protein [Halobacillus litoralis]|uniref:hypothetical protein n=1 Tax=Halobacillus litoralis TaxID=45668 RepID=UPI001CD297F9|nr:hypothetical protein [Halobacillus litoralis]MCA1021572.1 hypothetical protein [Halobacillus litoralis]
MDFSEIDYYSKEYQAGKRDGFKEGRKIGYREGYRRRSDELPKETKLLMELGEIKKELKKVSSNTSNFEIDYDIGY